MSASPELDLPACSRRLVSRDEDITPTSPLHLFCSLLRSLHPAALRLVPCTTKLCTGEGAPRVPFAIGMHMYEE